MCSLINRPQKNPGVHNPARMCQGAAIARKIVELEKQTEARGQRCQPPVIVNNATMIVPGEKHSDQSTVNTAKRKGLLRPITDSRIEAPGPGTPEIVKIPRMPGYIIASGIIVRVGIGTSRAVATGAESGALAEKLRPIQKFNKTIPPWPRASGQPCREFTFAQQL